MTKTLLVAAAPLLALGVGTGVASASVSATDVQQWISAQLAAEAGSPPDSVVCPADLDGDVGASVTCAVTRGDETRGVTVTVESWGDTGVNLSLAPARQ